MPSCAGAYVSGAAGSNACPAGSVRIEAAEACRTAVTAAGKTLPLYLPFVVTVTYSPRGCYYETSSNNANFNTHAVGAGSTSYQLLCATMTTGAPPHCTDAREGNSGAQLLCAAAATAGEPPRATDARA